MESFVNTNPTCSNNFHVRFDLPTKTRLHAMPTCRPCALLTRLSLNLMWHMLLRFWWFLVVIKSPKAKLGTAEWSQAVTWVPPSPPGPAMEKNSIQTCLWSQKLAFPLTFCLFATVPKCHFFTKKANTTARLSAYDLANYLPRPVRVCGALMC